MPEDGASLCCSGQTKKRWDSRMSVLSDLQECRLNRSCSTSCAAEYAVEVVIFIWGVRSLARKSLSSSSNMLAAFAAVISGVRSQSLVNYWKYSWSDIDRQRIVCLSGVRTTSVARIRSLSVLICVMLSESVLKLLYLGVYYCIVGLMNSPSALIR